MKKLTRKQKAFADELLKDQKISATQAALRTYGKPDKPTTYGTANEIARENLQKPAILEYLRKHQLHAENTIINVMEYSSDRLDDKGYARLALDTANSVLDRTIGKATTSDTNPDKPTVINLTLGVQVNQKPDKPIIEQ